MVKHLNIPYIKDLLISFLKITQNDNYYFTLQKTRHAIFTLSNKLNNTHLSLIFFMSYVEIDHSLGTKKRSYIDLLNQHTENCQREVEKIRDTIQRETDDCQTYVVSLDKHGEENYDFSLADRNLIHKILYTLGTSGNHHIANHSLTQVEQAFKSIIALLMENNYSTNLHIPHLETQYSKITMQSNSFTDFIPQKTIYYKKSQLLLARFINNDFFLTQSCQIQQKLQKKLRLIYSTSYEELTPYETLTSKIQIHLSQLSLLSFTIITSIIKYKKIYLQFNKSAIQIIIDEQLQYYVRQKLQNISKAVKQIYSDIFQADDSIIQKSKKPQLYSMYSQLKYVLDGVQETLMDMFKKQIGNNPIGKLSESLNYHKIKNALKNKLVKRINANPFMINQVYEQVAKIVKENSYKYTDLECQSGDIRTDIGNCVFSDYNFVKSIQNQDAIGIIFEIQRPQSAVADPGRIRIRQVSSLVCTVSKFFQKFLYKINFTPDQIKFFYDFKQCKVCKQFFCIYNCTEMEVRYSGQLVHIPTLNWNEPISTNSWDQKDAPLYQEKQIQEIRFKTGLMKSNYQEKHDYTDRAGRTPTTLAIMPLFLTEQHWRIARLLMKPCLGFTATGEPLGYTFSQFQTIPFMLLSAIIRQCKQLHYKIQSNYQQVQKISTEQELYLLQQAINTLKKQSLKLQSLKHRIQQTCHQIILDLSHPRYELPLTEKIYSLYTNYQQPINRTVDVISNNSCFIAQVLCIFSYKLKPLPSEQNFHQFFKRLAEEELRRQTYGWNDEYTEECFLNKLLNVEMDKIKEQEVYVVGSNQEYIDKYILASQGNRVEKNYIQMKKAELDLMIKKQGQFNDTQRLHIIECQNLYHNRVMWMWYVRFMLYQEIPKEEIQKWKCLNLNNSYKLFTLMIQNKKQRKNYKRREAILKGQYTDPFDYPEAYRYLVNEFVNFRSRKESERVKYLNQQAYQNAADIFCYTQVLQQAAGTLIDITVANNIRAFYEELARGKAVRLPQKMNMLLTGQYKGTKLFKGWIIGKQKTGVLRYKYPFEFEKYQYMF